MGLIELIGAGAIWFITDLGVYTAYRKSLPSANEIETFWKRNNFNFREMYWDTFTCLKRNKIKAIGPLSYLAKRKFLNNHYKALKRISPEFALIH